MMDIGVIIFAVLASALLVTAVWLRGYRDRVRLRRAWARDTVLRVLSDDPGIGWTFSQLKAAVEKRVGVVPEADLRVVMNELTEDGPVKRTLYPGGPERDFRHFSLFRLRRPLEG